MSAVPPLRRVSLIGCELVFYGRLHAMARGNFEKIPDSACECRSKAPSSTVDAETDAMSPADASSTSPSASRHSTRSRRPSQRRHREPRCIAFHFPPTQKRIAGKQRRFAAFSRTNAKQALLLKQKRRPCGRLSVSMVSEAGFEPAHPVNGH